MSRLALPTLLLLACSDPGSRDGAARVEPAGRAAPASKTRAAPRPAEEAPTHPRRLEPATEVAAREYAAQHMPPPSAEDRGIAIEVQGTRVRLVVDESGQRARIDGAALPPGTRLLPVLELPEIDLGITATPWAIVSADGRRAYLEDDVVYPLERAAPIDTSHTLTGARALAATQALRYLRACPVSRHECLLFGPPADVNAAVDPAAPPGGWFLDREPALTAGRTSGEPEPIADAAGLLSAPLPSSEDGEEMYRVFVRLGGRLVVAFDVPSLGAASGGVLERGGKTIVWLRDIEAVRIRLAVFEPDGRRSAVLGARAAAYEEVMCGNVFTSTRPLPVLIDGRLSVALGWSAMVQAILFDGPGRRGRVVPAVASEQLGADSWSADDLAPIWTLSPSGRLEPLAPDASSP